MTSALHSATAPEPRNGGFLRRGLRTLGICVLIAAVLSGWMDYSFLASLVHSVAIGMLCWIMIDLGRQPLARWKHRHALPGTPEALSDWPGWPLMLPLIVVGTVFGFSVGNTVAGWLTGHHSGGFFRGSLAQSFWLLMGAVVPGLLITYYFYSRETIAAKEAAIQTAQRQAAEHQLKLLESQLEPHMLFNTLANLRVLIGMDPPRAQAMLDQLIAFLRATLSGSRVAKHPLQAEFARLADYLALMELRMGPRLRTHFELPAELAELPVPPLLLQPLVENCIKHGLEPAVDGGRIDVSAARDGGVLVLRVRDTGVGLGEASTDGTRFGLVQVRERLAALYGARASLTLAAADDAEGGALATLRLPIDGAAT
ncbi:sensor histidine kinase [Rhizobacter fulvus]|jgi:hypothetical protein